MPVVKLVEAKAATLGVHCRKVSKLGKDRLHSELQTHSSASKGPLVEDLGRVAVFLLMRYSRYEKMMVLWSRCPLLTQGIAEWLELDKAHFPS